MAEDKADTRELTWRHLFPWTELFRGFQIALDVSKLLLAAAGIFVMAFWWWLLSLSFGAAYDKVPPQWPGTYQSTYQGSDAWKRFRQDRNNWNLMHRAANIGGDASRYEIADLAEGEEEYNRLKRALDKKGVPPEEAFREEGIDPLKAHFYADRLDRIKAGGALSTWPWFENRGPNPYLLVTGQAELTDNAGEQARFSDWLIRKQLPVMIEPVIKFVQPIVFFFNPHASIGSRFYFLFAILFAVVTWSIFGGAITRIAAVQITRGEKIGISEALRFTMKRLLSYVSAPLFPLIFILVLLIFTAIFGLFFMIPLFGDILVGGLFWPVPLIIGIIMGVVLVGLAVGWPLMAPTISTEGTDSWEAVSRSYSYVFQRPWQYIWYSLVGISYGAVCIFFVGFMVSFTVYLGKWAVSQTPFITMADREPNFLFVYSPTSFGWRELLLQGTTVEIEENGKKRSEELVHDGRINREAYDVYLGRKPSVTSPDTLRWYNKAGAVLVAFWLGLVFLMMLGFGYSFFWSISTIIYLLMRRQVDAAELDEVYLEEDEQEGPLGSIPAPPPAPPTAIKPSQPGVMVESPTLRTPPPPASPPPSEPAPEKVPEPAASLPVTKPAPSNHEGEEKPAP
jgi:hypothetical protein